MTLSPDAVLVMVDDNPADLFLARECFELSRLRNPWLSLVGGEALLEFLDRVAAGDEPMPGLILLDINMPRMSGHQVMEAIRAHPGFEQLPPVCMFTSSSDPREADRARDRGALGVVVKPDSPDDYVAFFDALGSSAGR